MDEIRFKNWLSKQKNYASGTIKNRISNCLKVNKYYDLEMFFKKGKTQELLNLLSYGIHDAINNIPAKHKIPINGDLYNGTATYKNAVNLYFEFKDNCQENHQNLSIEDNEICDLDKCIFSLIEKMNYVKKNYPQIAIFQNKLCDLLNEKVSNYFWSCEYKISHSFGDRIDIYGYNKNKNHHYIIELDPHRSDSIAKKFVSRIGLLLMENKKNITYLSLCYNGTSNMNVNECYKYFNYCNEVSKSLNIKYFGIIM